MGKPTGSPGKLERSAFPQYWPFPASPCRRAVNQKDKEFVAGLVGSANVRKFDLTLLRDCARRWYQMVGIGANNRLPQLGCSFVLSISYGRI